MSTLRSRAWWAASGVVATSLLLTGCVIGEVDRDSPTVTSDAATVEVTTGPAPTTGSEPGPTADDGSLDLPDVAGEAGVVLLDAGDGRSGGSLADLADAAWSTSKVPLAIAALNNAPGDETLAGQMRQAITASDNDAAEALWASLGDPQDAAAAVQDVLREGGDMTTTVPAEKRRAEFSTFGQTTWTLDDQVTFASELRCVSGSDPVLDAMGQVSADQSYGLGQFDGARFKGGWGPREDGTYLLRQFGLIPVNDGTMVPVAVAATATDGSYESAQGVLDQVVESVRDTVAGAHGVAADGDC
ncbi:hypothetical protein [Corynebacterium glyciniphilum]|uniref:hypothetical protein n=1 Tax=Corynebacterium glyciniphilum TaxID=1404244 RepID=UPI0021B3E65C|nr:hypothetical protein [Corynebacterium glyciniphilum]